MNLLKRLKEFRAKRTIGILKTIEKAWIFTLLVKPNKVRFFVIKWVQNTTKKKNKSSRNKKNRTPILNSKKENLKWDRIIIKIIKEDNKIKSRESSIRYSAVFKIVKTDKEERRMKIIKAKKLLLIFNLKENFDENK